MGLVMIGGGLGVTCVSGEHGYGSPYKVVPQIKVNEAAKVHPAQVLAANI